jgi:glycosyltransferase involved in cell wall biosynthesis
MRVLHVLGKLDRAGTQTWLMHVLRSNARQFEMDFLTLASGPGEYDDEVRSLGSRIFPCAYDRKPFQFAGAFGRLLRDEGPYDVVHSHYHLFTGWVLRVAHAARVPIRVAHSHSDTSPIDGHAGLDRRVKRILGRRWIDRHATLGLATSREAAACLFGPRWETDRRWRVLHSGIDLSPFEAECPDRDRVRAELGIRVDAFVVGHVGGFREEKNHEFLIDVANEAAQREPRFCLLLVGNGELRPAIEKKVARLGLLDRVIFAGSRSDVPRLIRGTMDAFVFPSIFEGLGLVAVEAQASGLTVLLSDVITPEVDVVPGLVRRMSLGSPASAWAEALLLLQEPRALPDRRVALQIVQQSAFNIEYGIDALQRAYAEGGNDAG